MFYSSAETMRFVNSPDGSGTPEAKGCCRCYRSTADSRWRVWMCSRIVATLHLTVATNCHSCVHKTKAPAFSVNELTLNFDRAGTAAIYHFAPR